MIVKHGLVRGVLGAIAGAATGVLEFAIIVEFFGFLYSTRKTIIDKGYKITHGTTAFAVELLWSRFSETNMNIAEAQYRASGYHEDNHPDFIGCLIVTDEQIMDGVWGSKIKRLIKDIDQIHDTTLLTNLDWDVTYFEKKIDKLNPGISWSPLSWHAVIPLYEYGMDPDFIKKIVMIPEYLEIYEKKNQIAFMPVFENNSKEPEFFHLPEDFITKSNEINYIDSVDDLLGFYRYYKKNKDFIDAEKPAEPVDYVSLPPVSRASTIISELQTGTFEPMKYMSDDKLKFEDWERWALSIYDQPAQRKGLIALEPLVRSINKLKEEIAEIETRNSNEKSDQLLKKMKKLQEKNPLYKNPYLMAVLVTQIVKGSRSARNMSMVAYRGISVLFVFQGDKGGLRSEEDNLRNKRDDFNSKFENTKG